MRILLIYPYAASDGTTRIHPERSLAPVGLYYVAAALKSEGYDVKVANWHDMRDQQDRLRAELAVIQPDVIGFSVLDFNRHGALQLAAMAKRINPGCVVVFGGPATTCLWHHFLTKFKQVDYVILHEGEHRLLELVRHIEDPVGEYPDSIDGLAFRKRDIALCCPPADVIENLDALADPADYFELPMVVYGRMHCAPGSFCGPSDSGQGIVRHHSLDYFVGQLKKLLLKGIDSVHITDDTLMLDKYRTIEFCRRMIAEKIFISWSISSRIDCVNAQILALMRQAGCYRIDYDLGRSASTIRSGQGCNYTDAQIKKTFHLTTTYGLLARARIILGFPGQTRDCLDEILDLLRQSRPLAMVLIDFASCSGSDSDEASLIQSTFGQSAGRKNVACKAHCAAEPQQSPGAWLQHIEIIEMYYYEALPEFIESIELVNDHQFDGLHSEFLGMLGDFFNDGFYSEIAAIPDKSKIAEQLYRRSLEYCHHHRSYKGLSLLYESNGHCRQAMQTAAQGLNCFPDSLELASCLTSSYNFWLRSGQIHPKWPALKELEGLKEPDAQGDGNIVYLVNAPHITMDQPNPALGQFKALLNHAGIRSKVLELPLLMAALISFSQYEKSWCGSLESAIFQAAWAPLVWGPRFSSSCDQLLAELAQSPKSVDEWMQNRNLLDRYEKVIKVFLAHVISLLRQNGTPGVVAFSCNMLQVIPALGLGRLIKTLYPRTRMVYGGPSFFGEMGAEYIRKIPWIDAVSTGEADDIIVPLCQALLEGRTDAGLQGMLYRKPDGGIVPGNRAQPVSVEFMDSLPVPDYRDYFEFTEQLGWHKEQIWQSRVHLIFEGARGCWWAEKCQCSFCGRSKEIMPYRVRSGKRVSELISTLAHKYPSSYLRGAEDAFSQEHFDSLIPDLIESAVQNDISLSYAVRVDKIDRHRMQLLSKAGVRIFIVGIESLSTRLLRLLRKGTTAMQNIYFLKLCRQYGMEANWNFLIHIPGERLEDYADVETLVPNILHLAPPHTGLLPMLLMRYSPYFNETKGLNNIRLSEIDRLLFPTDRIDAGKVAYIFQADWQDILPEDAFAGLGNAIKNWKNVWRMQPIPPKLCMRIIVSEDIIKIYDSRNLESSRTIYLDRDRTFIYELISDPRSFKDIMTALRGIDRCNLSEMQVKSILNEFSEQGLIFSEGRHYLALALADMEVVSNQND